MLTGLALHQAPSDPPPVEAFEAAAALRSRLADALMTAAALDVAISAGHDGATTQRHDALRRTARHLRVASDRLVELARLLDHPAARTP
jgi:hypothetical protein